MKHLTRTALIAVSLLAAGCFPDEHLWWSPDGTQLALLTPTGLRLSDPDGKLSDASYEGAQAAAWLPDGSGLIVTKQTEFDTWDAAKALVPAAEVQQVEGLAKGIPGLAAAVAMATGGEESKLEPMLKSLGFSDPELLGLAYDCALQTNRAAVEAALAAHGSEKMIKDLLETKPSFKVYEIAVVTLGDGQALGAPKPLVHSLFPLGAPLPSPSPRHGLAYSAGPLGLFPSPTHCLVAFTAGKSLRIAALDGSAPLEVTDANLGPCAWSPDGMSLVYLSPLTPPGDDNSLVLASLCLRTVAGADGKLLKNTGEVQTPETCPEPTTLATVAVSGPQRLAVLPDGRVLFASVASSFPIGANAEEGERLFLLDPALGEKAVPVPVPVDSAVWPGSLQHFVLSPDGKKIALVDGGRDAVAVLELATGKFGIVAPDRGRKCRTLPAWRSNDELSFAALPEEKSERPEVMILKLGQSARAISKTWDAEILNGMLEKTATTPEPTE